MDSAKGWPLNDGLGGTTSDAATGMLFMLLERVADLERSTAALEARNAALEAEAARVRMFTNTRAVVIEVYVDDDGSEGARIDPATWAAAMRDKGYRRATIWKSTPEEPLQISRFALSYDTSDAMNVDCLAKNALEAADATVEGGRVAYVDIIILPKAAGARDVANSGFIEVQ